MVQDDFDFLWIRRDVGSGHGLFVFFPDPIHKRVDSVWFELFVGFDSVFPSLRFAAGVWYHH